MADFDCLVEVELAILAARTFVALPGFGECYDSVVFRSRDGCVLDGFDQCWIAVGLECLEVQSSRSQYEGTVRGPLSRTWRIR